MLEVSWLRQSVMIVMCHKCHELKKIRLNFMTLSSLTVLLQSVTNFKHDAFIIRDIRDTMTHDTLSYSHGFSNEVTPW